MPSQVFGTSRQALGSSKKRRKSKHLCVLRYRTLGAIAWIQFLAEPCSRLSSGDSELQGLYTDPKKTQVSKNRHFGASRSVRQTGFGCCLPSPRSAWLCPWAVGLRLYGASWVKGKSNSVTVDTERAEQNKRTANCYFAALQQRQNCSKVANCNFET